MKFKFKPPKSNLILMISLFILLVFTSLVWIIFKEYHYFVFYMTSTLFLIYTYFFTYYTLTKDKLIIKIGLFKIGIKYSKIIDYSTIENGIKLHLKYYKLNIYPNNSKIFLIELKEKLTNKN